MKEIELNLKPYISVGPLEFGKTRKEIRSIMESYDVCDSFTRNESSDGPTDGYYNNSLFLDYDKDDKLCSVEVADLEVIYELSIINIQDLVGLKHLSKNTDHFIDGTLFLDRLGVVIGHVTQNDDIQNYEEIESILIASKEEYAELIEAYTGLSK
jgi:hypothetical protein